MYQTHPDKCNQQERLGNIPRLGWNSNSNSNSEFGFGKSLDWKSNLLKLHSLCIRVQQKAFTRLTLVGAREGVERFTINSNSDKTSRHDDAFDAMCNRNTSSFGADGRYAVIFEGKCYAT